MIIFRVTLLSYKRSVHVVSSQSLLTISFLVLVQHASLSSNANLWMTRISDLPHLFKSFNTAPIRLGFLPEKILAKENILPCRSPETLAQEP